MGKGGPERVNCGIHRRHGVGSREAAAAVLLHHKDEPESLALLGSAMGTESRASPIL